MNPNITFSTAAIEYIKKMVEKKDGIGFRLTVKKTGCSGFSYLPEIIDQMKSAGDVEFSVDGVHIFIDSSWMHLLEGVQVDYIEEDKSGLKQKRLVFTNPKESSRCGCGESFQI